MGLIALAASLVGAAVKAVVVAKGPPRAVVAAAAAVPSAILQSVDLATTASMLKPAVGFCQTVQPVASTKCRTRRAAYKKREKEIKVNANKTTIDANVTVDVEMGATEPSGEPTSAMEGAASMEILPAKDTLPDSISTNLNIPIVVASAMPQSSSPAKISAIGAPAASTAGIDTSTSPHL